MAKKAEAKFRMLEKQNGKIETKIGKYYQIGDKHSIKADKILRIETDQEVIEHDIKDSLPEKLKVKI
jgi:hypothetical protein